MERHVDLAGWLVREKGRYLLGTGTRWHQLTSVPDGSGHDRPVRVRARLLPDGDLDVIDVRPPQGPAVSGPPVLVRSPKDHLLVADRLRARAGEWLREQGYPYVTLPQAWFRTEEYGEREFRLDHALLSQDLRLLQSPELPLYQALAMGLGSCHTFGRCFRHEVVHDPDAEGTYLMEFEQLVVGLSVSDLRSAVRLAQDLVIALAAEVGVRLSDSSFVTTDLLAAAGATQAPPALDDVDLLTIPASWSSQAVQVLAQRLESVGAEVYLCADDTLVPLRTSELRERAGATLRLALRPDPARREETRRVLDVVTTMTGAVGASVADSVALAWNPTWQVHPSLDWTDEERKGSDLSVRSFTSRWLQGPHGMAIADAELHLGGVEVVHVREYADVDDLISQAAYAGALGEYDYVKPYSDAAPPGLVGVFFGWERLTGVLAGAKDAHQMLVFPRNGNAELELPR